MSKNKFVILEHKTPAGIHWDLMLENEEKLWTWRLDIHPAELHFPVTAERIFDHPLKFLSYEGPVQKSTASVKKVDKGTLSFHRITPEAITCQLDGKIVNGRYALHLQNAPMWTFDHA